MDLDAIASELAKTWWLKRLHGISLSDVPPILPRFENFSSRFEHSVNVYRLSKVVVKNNNLPYEVAIGGLLHDIGHAPFGHVSDLFLRMDEFGKNHITYGSDLIRSGYGGRKESEMFSFYQ